MVMTCINVNVSLSFKLQKLKVGLDLTAKKISGRSEFGTVIVGLWSRQLLNYSTGKKMLFHQILSNKHPDDRCFKTHLLIQHIKTGNFIYTFLPSIQPAGNL